MGTEADRIKADVSVEQVARAVLPTVAFARRGKYSFYECPSPRHQGNSANNRARRHSCLNHDRNTFYCNGCETGGSVIDFVMFYEGCDFTTALKRVAEIGGITLETRNGRSLPANPRVAMLNVARRWWKTHPDAAQYHEYWEKARMLSPEAAVRFQPGIAPGGKQLTMELLKMGYTAKQLIDARVTSTSGWDVLQKRLLVATNGNIVGRSILQAAERKVLVFEGGYTGFFNEKDASRFQKVIAVEGVFDGIAVWELLRDNGLDAEYGVIALHGTKAYQKEWLGRLAEAGVEEIYGFLDMDAWFNADGKPHAKGQYANLELAITATQFGLTPWIIKAPEGRDPNDYLKAIRKGEFALADVKQRLTDAVTPWEFALEIESNFLDTTRLSGQVHLLEKAKQLMPVFGVPVLGTAWEHLAQLIVRPVDEVKEYLADAIAMYSFDTATIKGQQAVATLRGKGLTDCDIAACLGLDVAMATDDTPSDAITSVA